MHTSGQAAGWRSKAFFTDHQKTTRLTVLTISLMTSVRMKNFQGILLYLKMRLGLAKPHQIFLLCSGGYVHAQEILTSIHIHTYSRIAILHSHFQTEIRCSEMGNKDFLRRSTRQKQGFSIKLTTLAVDYSFCLCSIN